MQDRSLDQRLLRLRPLLRGLWGGLALLLTTGLLMACTSGSGTDVADAAPRRKRDAGTSVTMSCIRCSMLAQILVSDSGPPGGMDPCAGGGMPGGGGGFTFCNEAVFNSFIGCMQARCAASCPFGPGMGMGDMMMCPPDAGTPQPRDAGMTDAGAIADAGSVADAGSGASCGACITTQCAAEYAQCGADK